MPMLLARIMGLRNEDHGAVARQVSLNASDPALIAANIAEKPSPPYKELYQSPKSRFTKSGEVEKSVRLYYNQFYAVFWIRWPLKVKLSQALLVYFFPSLVHWNAFYISLMCSTDMDFYPCQYAKKNTHTHTHTHTHKTKQKQTKKNYTLPQVFAVLCIKWWFSRFSSFANNDSPALQRMIDFSLKHWMKAAARAWHNCWMLSQI